MTSRSDNRPASPSATKTRSAASRCRPGRPRTWEDQTMTTAASPAEHAAAGSIGRRRWIVVALLFTAMVVNYVDRQTIGFLKGDLSHEYGWSETNYADLVFWFQ